MSKAEFRSGYVGVVGRPNVGKSTLVNQILGQKIAAVSPRPQTTQRNQLGILTTAQYQLILVDTPGIHQPVTKMGDFMNESALGTFSDVDVILWIVDISVKPFAEDINIAQKIKALNLQGNTLIALNKADLVVQEDLEKAAENYLELLPEAESLVISAQIAAGVDRLLERLFERIPVGPQYFPEDQITDLYERQIACDLIRESLLMNLSEEIPHAIAVRLDEYKDRSEKNAYIHATLLLDRESHKPIVIGKKGAMIRKIGEYARMEIEKLTDRNIYLELNVKVEKNWRNNPKVLRALGYFIRKD
jgi:GTP-binding protein Era